MNNVAWGSVWYLIKDKRELIHNTFIQVGLFFLCMFFFFGGNTYHISENYCIRSTRPFVQLLFKMQMHTYWLLYHCFVTGRD